MRAYCTNRHNVYSIDYHVIGFQLVSPPLRHPGVLCHTHTHYSSPPPSHVFPITQMYVRSCPAGIESSSPPSTVLCCELSPLIGSRCLKMILVRLFCYVITYSAFLSLAPPPVSFSLFVQAVILSDRLLLHDQIRIHHVFFFLFGHVCAHKDWEARLPNHSSIH
ncbi:unnamed protein product [Calicophoron daubneyi]|uniref:Uncharacterized protein n=1 Tax=Calicophoron daubneyi TaxID=300641 RepID=A0AAV2T779_CALDB